MALWSQFTFSCFLSYFENNKLPSRQSGWHLPVAPSRQPIQHLPVWHLPVAPIQRSCRRLFLLPSWRFCLRLSLVPSRRPCWRLPVLLRHLQADSWHCFSTLPPGRHLAVFFYVSVTANTCQWFSVGSQADSCQCSSVGTAADSYQCSSIGTAADSC